MPIAAAASNALKSQKAKANQQEAKTKAGVDPELLYFFSEPKYFSQKCGPKPIDFTSRAPFGIIFLQGVYFDINSYFGIRGISAPAELGQSSKATKVKGAQRGALAKKFN